MFESGNNLTSKKSQDPEQEWCSEFKVVLTGHRVTEWDKLER